MLHDRMPFRGTAFRFNFSSLAVTSLLVALLLPALGHAKPIPVEDLFRNPDVVAAQLSPDGKSVALTTSINGKKCLAVMDLASAKILELAEYSDAEVSTFFWTSNDRLLYTLSYLYDEHHWSGIVDDGLFAINRDGSDARELMSTMAKQVERHARITHSLHVVGQYDDVPNEVLAEDRNGKEPGVAAVRLNTVTGARHEINISVSGELHAFWADHTTTIRLAKTASNDIGREVLWYRDGEGAPWKKIAELDKLLPQFNPVAFDTDNKTLFVAAKNGRDKDAIYKFDFASNSVGELVYANEEANVGGGLAFARDTHRLFGIRYFGDQPGVYWIDKQREKIQNAIDAALPGQMNDVTGDEYAAGLLIHSHSDANPGIYYFYNPETHKLKKLFSTRPAIHADDLSAQLVFHYPARDGLDIPAYLTLPKGKPAKSLPLIVLVHGGPWARDYWGYSGDVQFLASRGYAVLQPEFRSSTGFGAKLFNQGWKQWGLSMQDDITDGVQNLVKQGVVDSARVCIMGASYGGYAAMMGVAKDPALYRCAIDMFGVTDIKLQRSISDWADEGMDEFRRYGFKQLIGDLDHDSAQFDATSPLKLAGKIKVPILMVYGDKDNRVPIAEGEQLRDALQKQGDTVEWITLEGEGHGMRKESNRYQFFHALDAFLKKYDPVD